MGLTRFPTNLVHRRTRRVVRRSAVRQSQHLILERFQERRMKPTLIAILATTLVLGIAAHAQTMVEYSNLGTAASRALKSTPPVAPKMPQQPAAGAPAGPSTTAPAVDPNAPQAVIWEAPEAPGKKQAPAPPPPPAIFILANGDHIETTRY